MSATEEIIFETDTFVVQVPPKPFVSREDGGHLRILCKLHVKDRTELNLKQSIEYALLSEIVGKSLEEGMNARGIEVGNINWQEMGNWSVHKPEGIRLHMHVFGRAKKATTQIYGEAVRLPFRETGFYDDFAPLNRDDITCITQHAQELLKYTKYRELTVAITPTN